MAGNYGYTSAAYVFHVTSRNGKPAWIVAATMGEAVDRYISASGASKLDTFQTINEPVTAVIVDPNIKITSGTDAGASSAVSATCDQWAATYASAVAAGLSGANSSQGTAIILTRNS